jgi:phage terminase large subunit GpA-like protein
MLRLRRKVLPSVWCEEHRVLTMSSLPGPWKNHVTPYLVGIMDAIWHPAVECVICCKAPQTGMTEAIYNCIGYAADCDPGPVLVVMPDEITARDNSRDRIQPMFSSSTRLSRYLTGSRDDLSGLRINLTHMPIYMAWARSAARLANKPIRMVFFDEIDKYPDFSNQREADPISLGTKRTITYRRTRKIVKGSTPTIEAGPITQAMRHEAQAVFDWVAVCPDCRREQVMVFGQIKWGDSRDAEEVEQQRRARYECRHCGSLWDDARRDQAVRHGCWRARVGDEPDGDHGGELMDYLDRQRPAKIGFHIPSWVSHFVSLSDAAAAFLRGLRDKTKLRDFKNNHEAAPWVIHQQARKEDAILALRDERPAGMVPSAGVVAALTAGIDTQDNGFWYEVRAWGWGQQADSWQVRFGFVESFAALEQVLFGSEYKDADGVRHALKFALIDSGGHRTAEVYDYCRTPHPAPVMAAKGQGRMSGMHTVGKIDVYPGTTKAIPGGVKLLNLNVNQYKDALDGRLQVLPVDPGAWRMCAECSEEWARQMTAEVIDDKTGMWINPKNRANHAWDCSVLNLAAADFMGVRFWPRPEPKKSDPAAERPPIPAPAPWIQRAPQAGATSWIRRR